MRPQSTENIRTMVDLATAACFVALAVINLLRWEVLEGWYVWATWSALAGGLLLLIFIFGGPRFHFRFRSVFLNALLIFGALLALDALAFFIVMRIPMDWKDYLTFCPAPAFLLLRWIIYFVFRKKS